MIRFAAIVGTRHELTPEDEQNVLDFLHAEVEDGWSIITGDATGVDALARKFATMTNRACFTIAAPWDTLGSPLAAHTRNEIVARVLDELFAFPCKHSKGTRDTIRRATGYDHRDQGFAVECVGASTLGKR